MISSKITCMIILLKCQAKILTLIDFSVKRHFCGREKRLLFVLCEIEIINR